MHAPTRYALRVVLVLGLASNLTSAAFGEVGEVGEKVTPAPAPPPAPRTEPVPYALRLDVDIARLSGGTVLWGGTSVIGGASAPPSWCGTMSTPPCDPNGVNALDRTAIGLYDPKAGLAADVLTAAVPGGFVVLDIVDAG